MIFLRRVALLCTACMMVSCIDMDYDLKQLDTSLTLFGNGVSMPLGTTARIMPGEIIDPDSMEGLVTNADGTYSLNFSKDTTISGNFEELKDVLEFKASRFELDPVCYDLCGVSSSIISAEKINVDITQTPIEVISSGTSIGNIAMQSDLLKDFNFSVAEGVDNFGTVKIYPEGNPVMRVHFVKSSSNVSIRPESDGVKLYIPKCIVLKDVPSLYIYDKVENTVTVPASAGELSTVALTVDYITADPEKDENNKYFIKGVFRTGGHVRASSNADVRNFTLKMEVDCDSFKPKTISFKKFSADFDTETNCTIINSTDISRNLVSASQVELDDAQLALSLTVTNVPDFEGTSPKIIVDAEIPEWIETDSRTIHLEGFLDAGGKLNCTPVRIRRLNLTGIDLDKDITAHFNLHVKVEADNPVLLISSLDGDIITCTGSCDVSEFNVTRLSGQFDYSIEPQSFSIDLSNLRKSVNDKFDIVSDLLNPALLVDMDTNFGIPVDAEFTIIPYTDGKPGNGVRCRTALPYTTSAFVSKNKGIFLCNSDADMPQGYEFAKCDLGGILKEIPDSLAVTFGASTNPKEIAGIEPFADYTAGISCRFNAPLRFGEDFCFGFSDTLDARGAAKYIADTRVRIGGEVTSTLPVKAEIQLTFLDGEYREIPFKHPVTQVIEAGSADGAETLTKLDIDINPEDRDTAAELQWIKLSFHILSSGSGRALKESDYLQAKLYLALPEGYTTDIKR